jgi:hypothetical protein
MASFLPSFDSEGSIARSREAVRRQDRIQRGPEKKGNGMKSCHGAMNNENVS